MPRPLPTRLRPGQDEVIKREIQFFVFSLLIIGFLFQLKADVESNQRLDELRREDDEIFCLII